MCWNFAVVRTYIFIFFTGLLSLFLPAYLRAQNCPENIGFEEGNFNRWETLSGEISTTGVIDVKPTNPINGIHSIYKYSYPQITDPYGGFPVNSPNGSTYSVMLGNAGTQRGAERITYTFTVPTNTSGYSFIYNYAVVFQNPDHADYEQPKFTAKLFDVTANRYADCGSFEYVASAGLPGFKTSLTGRDVFYKEWTPVTINLSGFEGKTMRLEFTTNDCTRGGHFGYAYIDVNENCSSPISGSAYCIGDNRVTLRAPEGFKEYFWYDESGSTILSQLSILSISPAPPDQTKYALRIVPYPNQGCESTVYTTIRAISEEVKLEVKPLIEACENLGADLTAAYVTAGSSQGLIFSYYSDADATKPIPREPVRQNGIYYIKAENVAGCYKIKPIQVRLFAPATFTVKADNQICAPGTYNLKNALNSESTTGIEYTYWTDQHASIPLANPDKVAASGTYYIKGSYEGCYTIVPVVVTITPKPVLSLNAITACPPVNLTLASLYDGSTVGLTYTYWLDAAATQPLINPDKITQSGIYFLKGATSGGCFAIAPVTVTVNEVPSLAVSQPAAVVYPATVNIDAGVEKKAGFTYSYWRDAALTKPLENEKAIANSGTYYVKVTNDNRCSTTIPITVAINPPPDPIITIGNAFSPNSDGVNDLFKLQVTGTVNLRYFKVFNRYGKEVYLSTSFNNAWDGTSNGLPVPTGTYFWMFEGVNSYSGKRMLQSGSVTVVR